MEEEEQDVLYPHEDLDHDELLILGRTLMLKLAKYIDELPDDNSRKIFIQEMLERLDPEAI